MGFPSRRANEGARAVSDDVVPGCQYRQRREGAHTVCVHAFPVRPLQQVMDALVERLVNDTVSLLGAVARGDTHRAWVLADRLRMAGWKWAMPGLASAAGAFQQSLESGPSSEAEMALAVQAIAFEMQDIVRSSA